MTMPDAGKQNLQFQFMAGATDLFGIAKRCSDIAATTDEISKKDLRDNNLVAIMFSALAVEAFLNELGTIDASSQKGSGSDYKPSLVAIDSRLEALQRVLRLAEESNLQSLGKIQLAHEILGLKLENGQQPFQDYRLLKQLRDSIAHSKPSNVVITTEPIEFQSSREKLLQALYSRKLLSYKPSERGQGLLDWLDGKNLAQWAIKAASKMVIKIIEALPTGEFKEAIVLFYRDFYLNKEEHS
jgi:hypothetical protein